MDTEKLITEGNTLKNHAERRKDNPAISVIVPVYNQGEFLRRCVDSILAQTFKDFEVLLIDDGSTDNSGIICDEYASAFDCVRVIHQSNKGLSGARNTGIDNAKADLLMFCDSDDEMLPTMIESLLEVMERTDADITQCSFWQIYPDGMIPEDIPDECFELSAIPGELRIAEKLEIKDEEISIYEKDRLFTEFLSSGWRNIVQWNKLFKCHIFDTIRFPEGRYHEDEWIIHYELDVAERVASIDRRLYLYYRHGASITWQETMKKKYDAICALEDRRLFMLDKGVYCQLPHLNHYINYIAADAKERCDEFEDSDKWLPLILEIAEKDRIKKLFHRVIGRINIKLLNISHRLGQ